MLAVEEVAEPVSELALLLVETAGVETAGVETAAACRLLGRGDPRGDILLLAGTAAIRRRLLLHARPMYISGASSSSEQQSADMSPHLLLSLMRGYLVVVSLTCLTRLL